MPIQHSYECTCGPCSVHKIAAKSQGVEPNDDIGCFLGSIVLFFGGIFLIGSGYVALMFISMFDIMTFQLFNWDWLWWGDGKEF